MVKTQMLFGYPYSNKGGRTGRQDYKVASPKQNIYNITNLKGAFKIIQSTIKCKLYNLQIWGWHENKI